MKTMLLTLNILLITGFTMCEERSITTNSASNFKVDSNTYYAGSQGSIYNSTKQLFYFSNSNKDTLMTIFLTKPTTKSAYAVINNDTDIPSANSCGIGSLVGGGLIQDYYSLGRLGDSVFVTVSPTGKLSATFSNVCLLV